MKVKARLEHKINVTLPALLPNKIVQDSRGLVTSSDKTGHEEHGTRNKRAIPLLAIVQGTAAIGGMLIKGINALVDAKRANSFNNATKMLNANVEITHNRLVTLENRTSMMVKAIMPALTKLMNDWLRNIEWLVVLTIDTTYFSDKPTKHKRYIILPYYCSRII